MSYPTLTKRSILALFNTDTPDNSSARYYFARPGDKFGEWRKIVDASNTDAELTDKAADRIRKDAKKYGFYIIRLVDSCHHFHVHTVKMLSRTAFGVVDITEEIEGGLNESNRFDQSYTDRDITNIYLV
jgi:hypothetical protein